MVIASEAVPFAKTGGLADVAGALPPALERLGLNVSLIIPGYRIAWDAGVPIEPTGVAVRVAVGGRAVEANVLKSKLPGSNVDVYLIDEPGSFDRDGLYQSPDGDHPDNSSRFVLFARAALEAIRVLNLRPDVIHCNDWQTGLVPVYLEEVYRRRPEFARTGTLLTIHNLAFQGNFWHWDMALTGLDWRLFNYRHLEFHHHLNFLKAGLVYADVLNTVSPTYAAEIQTADPNFGRGLDGVLRHRTRDLHGIVNGIDTTVWNPSRDVELCRETRYDVSTAVAGKAACKARLQGLAGLPRRADVPLFAQIGRLDPQKGWDLIAEVADDLLLRDVQLVVLGTGEARYEALLRHLVKRYAGKVQVFLMFSESLAHQIAAGADMFLMPSLYEPCGLTQLYSLAYGTVPIVRRTGGLADTVIDGTTGFVFHEGVPQDLPARELLEARAAAFWGAIERASVLRADREAWGRLIASGMRADWSWDRSAREYVRLYEEVRRRRVERSLT